MADHVDDPACASDELVDEIVRRYELGTYHGWHDFGGSSTTNVRIDLRDRGVVARVHRQTTSQERLTAIQAAKYAVARAGIPTPTPIPLEDGAGFTTLTSGHLVEIEPLLHWDTRMNNEALVERGHRVLAAVHNALRLADLPTAAATAPYANYIDPMAAVEASRHGVRRIHSWRNRQLSAFADAALDHIETVARLEAPLRAGQPQQIVHGDFWDNNVLFSGDTLVAVIDFDFMARRPRIEDLALTAYFLLLQPGRGLPTRTDARMLRRFVRAYDATADMPLGAEEKAALPLAIARQPAWSLGRWIVELPERDARRHTADVMSELPVAQAILTDIDYWQHTLTS